MKVGFIGAGNMGATIIKAMVTKKFILPENIYAFSPTKEKLIHLAKEVGFNTCPSNAALVEKVDTILLAVKPDMITSILKDIAKEIKKKEKLIISIATGTSLTMLEEALNVKTAIIRVMPNVNLMVGEGVTAVCGNTLASREQIDFVLSMFRAAGTAVEIEEKYFSAYTAIAGSSPAYAYLFIDSMARAAVNHGMPKKLATKIAAQAVLGSAKMVLDSDEIPWALIDKVCSPAGTTVAGLLTLEDERFTSTVVKAIDATIARDQEIMKK